MPVVTYNATNMVELKRERLFKISTRYGRYTRKNTVFDYFFHKLTKRITSESDTAGTMGPTCCPTIRSTGINPQLFVPVGYAHQIFGTNVNFGGSYENVTTFWLGFRNQ